jgi:uncharacterized protein YdhG (YjbR/CyaY superfamily)
MLTCNAMAKTDFNSVDDYIAAQPEAVQGLLQSVRAAIRKAVPRAEEVISYRIPTYRLPAGPVLYFAGWKAHFSLYPASEQLVSAFKDELAGFKISKGTIRFPLSEAVPQKLIARIAKFRAEEVAARAAAKTALPKKAGPKKAPSKKAPSKKAPSKKAPSKKPPSKKAPPKKAAKR